MRYWNALVIAFATYSRIPMPRVDWSDENRKYAMCFFPLIGAVVGLVMALWLGLCDWLGLGGFLRGAVGAMIPILITGGIHMDGFMDTSDAMASWQPKERRLEILKDSHVGAFAVIGCSAYMLVMAGLLSEATLKSAPMIGMCYVLSRALSAWTMTVFASARPNGMLDSFARTAQRRMVSISSAICAVACALIWAACGGWTAALCLAAVGACVAAYRRMAYQYFGGVTGDLAGWFLQVTEMCCIAMAIIGGMLI